MRYKRIRILILLAVFAIVGIIISQVFWIRKGLLINQVNFEEAVVTTLEQITAGIWKQKGITDDPSTAVVRLSPRSYLVHINTPIDVNELNNRLKKDFANPFHNIDFTYEVYQTGTDLIVFTDSIFISQMSDVEESQYLPNLTESNYYFKVNFPERPLIPSLMISIWAAAIVILILVLGFFAYSIFVVLRQQRLSDFQTAFINTLAHEFKTPISTIGISANVLSEPDIAQEPERIGVYSNIIRLENERMKGQVNKILELASLENREVQLRREYISVKQVLEELTLGFAVQVEERNGRLDRVCLEQDFYIYADKVHFVNVFNTLLDNALKYTEADPHIVFTMARVGSELQMSIRDNGIGIPREYQRKIFEKFFRVPTGDVHNVKGFGLGLSYVHLIVKAHGWKISVSSELNKGSTFVITMPVYSQIPDIDEEEI